MGLERWRDLTKVLPLPVYVAWVPIFEAMQGQPAGRGSLGADVRMGIFWHSCNFDCHTSSSFLTHLICARISSTFLGRWATQMAWALWKESSCLMPWNKCPVVPYTGESYQDQIRILSLNKATVFLVPCIHFFIDIIVCYVINVSNFLCLDCRYLKDFVGILDKEK